MRTSRIRSHDIIRSHSVADRKIVGPRAWSGRRAYVGLLCASPLSQMRIAVAIRRDVRAEPLCYPRYKKGELKSFLQLHREGEEPLREDEVRTSASFVLMKFRSAS